MEHKANHPVNSTKKSLTLIQVLKEQGPARLADLETELPMGKSAIHNHLSTLREHEYVLKTDGKYHLGLKFLEIGGEIRNQTRLFCAARSKSDRLSDQTDELVTLFTKDCSQGMILYQSQGSQAIELNTHVGARIPLHSTAMGKAILAHMPRSKLESTLEMRGLPSFTSNTITNRDRLYEELETIREEGYAFDDEERWRGLRCIAAPIISDNGEVRGSIGIVAPKSRMGGKEVRVQRIKQVKKASNLIEVSITHS